MDIKIKSPRKIKGAKGGGDCFTCAIVNAGVMPYSKAHKFNNEWMQKFYPNSPWAKDSSQGVKLSLQVMDYLCRKLGWRMVWNTGRTLGDTQYHLSPEGTYIIVVTGHALVYKNGTYIDIGTTSPRKIVKFVFRID